MPSKPRSRPTFDNYWTVIVDHLHWNGDRHGKFSDSIERAARQMANGYGAFTLTQLDAMQITYDWSHVRDSTDDAKKAIAIFLCKRLYGCTVHQYVQNRPPLENPNGVLPKRLYQIDEIYWREILRGIRLEFNSKRSGKLTSITNVTKIETDRKEGTITFKREYLTPSTNFTDTDFAESVLTDLRKIFGDTEFVRFYLSRSATVTRQFPKRSFFKAVFGVTVDEDGINAKNLELLSQTSIPKR